MRDPDWLRLFPDEDFRWSMHLRPGDAKAFFDPSPEESAILEERSRLLQSCPERYTLFPAGEENLVNLALERFGAWRGRSFLSGLEAGKSLEPDWVLLRSGAEPVFRIAAGVVCFPSHWSLPEKASLPLEAVHAPAPSLNESLGQRIATFLDKLGVGAEWERENWGLSADAKLDHHPANCLPSLSETHTVDSVWIRLERQLLVRLSGDSILFGIRVSNHRLDQVIDEHPAIAPRVCRALATMPDAAASYKGLARVRGPLVSQLRTGYQDSGSFAGGTDANP